MEFIGADDKVRFVTCGTHGHFKEWTIHFEWKENKKEYKVPEPENKQTKPKLNGKKIKFSDADYLQILIIGLYLYALGKEETNNEHIHKYTIYKINMVDLEVIKTLTLGESE